MTSGRDKPLWRPAPAAIADANMTAFMRLVHSRHCVNVDDYAALHRWSIENLEDFWTTLWDFAGIVAATRGETVLADGDRMPGARFFPDARLNFAENLLKRRDRGREAPAGSDDSAAIVFRGENRVPNDRRKRSGVVALLDLVGGVDDLRS